ncbi:lipid II:glycine glycyltransferase FemX [Anaerolinea thermolimosa]|nr:peptidoglycan bridge formation glycyltransferase FemA/FemB family protein [Anaerolinea thermolimosa]
MIAKLPGANILQTREWAELKGKYGWEACPQVWRNERGEIFAAAMILSRRVRFPGMAGGWSVLYVPRGPLLDWTHPGHRQKVINTLEALARQRGVIFLKIDPEVPLGYGVPGTEGAVEVEAGAALRNELNERGWIFSKEQIQFRNTAVLDLLGDEADWLGRMKPKARYNLRLAQRKGVTVRLGGEDDFDLLYRMYAETAVRDGFVIRPLEYYRMVWNTFSRRGMCFPLIAEVSGEAVAGLVLFVFAGRAWYLYGMSRDLHREKMPNYLLQWEAMRLACAKGASSYDLWGAPDVFNESDSMWGVFRFKEGLGARVVRTLGAWDYTARPLSYRMYTQILPRVLEWMRRRGKARTRRDVGV